MSIWRRWNERSSPERFDFYIRVSLYATLLVFEPFLVLSLVGGQQQVRVPDYSRFVM